MERRARDKMSERVAPTEARTPSTANGNSEKPKRRIEKYEYIYVGMDNRLNDNTSQLTCNRIITKLSPNCFVRASFCLKYVLTY